MAFENLPKSIALPFPAPTTATGNIRKKNFRTSHGISELFSCRKFGRRNKLGEASIGLEFKCRETGCGFESHALRSQVDAIRWQSNANPLLRNGFCFYVVRTSSWRPESASVMPSQSKNNVGISHGRRK
jgi:hypothetical protein